MRSDTIYVSNSGEGVEKALAQAEAVAVFKGLSKKDALHLRLLTEEMMGMLCALTGETDARFYIEDTDGDFRLHLVTETSMDSEKRKRLLDSSSTGKNAAAKGVMGKLRDLFERSFEPLTDNVPSYYAIGWVGSDADPFGMELPVYDEAWSLNRYRDAVRDDAEAWDELEKSIVANLADEIRIGIRGGTVEMVIYKKI